MSRQSILSQGFNVLNLENKLYRKTEQKPYYEISSTYNYNEGYYLNAITANGVEIGEYHRDPWGQGWFGKSFYNGGIKQRFATDKNAIAFIQNQFLATR